MEEQLLLEESIELVLLQQPTGTELNDQQAVTILGNETDNRFGPVRGGCWGCGLEIRQHAPLVPAARCPFCNKFMRRIR